MTDKEKVKEILEKQKPEESEEEEEDNKREIHPLESSIIFKEELLIQLSRIAVAIENLKGEDEKPTE